MAAAAGEGVVAEVEVLELAVARFFLFLGMRFIIRGITEEELDFGVGAGT